MKQRRADEFKVNEIFPEELTRCEKKNIAVVAVARKVLCILLHLLMNHENYQEPEVRKTKPIDTQLCLPIRMMEIDEMIKIVRQDTWWRKT